MIPNKDLDKWRKKQNKTQQNKTQQNKTKQKKPTNNEKRNKIFHFLRAIKLQ